MTPSGRRWTCTTDDQTASRMAAGAGYGRRFQLGSARRGVLRIFTVRSLACLGRRLQPQRSRSPWFSRSPRGPRRRLRPFRRRSCLHSASDRGGAAPAEVCGERARRLTKPAARSRLPASGGQARRRRLGGGRWPGSPRQKKPAAGKQDGAKISRSAEKRPAGSGQEAGVSQKDTRPADRGAIHGNGAVRGPRRVGSV